MAIQITHEGNTAVVAVNGRLDAVTGPEYQKTVRQLSESGITRVVVDLQGLSYISSAGLGELLVTSKLLQENGGQFCVVNVHGNVQSVFQICGIGKVIQVRDTVADALMAFA